MTKFGLEKCENPDARVFRDMMCFNVLCSVVQGLFEEELPHNIKLLHQQERREKE